MSQIEIFNSEINTEIKDINVQKALLSTTFKGLNLNSAKQAMLEGMMRGFKFSDFLHKNVYAVPFGQGYSLVTSIDYARKIAMRSGLAGKSAPVYTFKADGKVETCTVTVKRSANGVVGDYTATVYFDEYTTGKNLWVTKPKTMIAKVAEMHAMRAGFPEEMAQQYVSEEIEKETTPAVPPADQIPVSDYKVQLMTAKTIAELQLVWGKIPKNLHLELNELKNELKDKLTTK